MGAAARLFGEHGYDAVRTGEIARAAGVAEGTLFHHFASKQGLLRAVAERYGRGFADAMFEDIDSDGEVPDPEAVIRNAFAYVRHSDPLFGVFLLSDELGESAVAKTSNREAIVAYLADSFGRWRRRGLIRAPDERVAAELCFGLVEAALKECFVRGRRNKQELYVSEVARAIRAMLTIPADTDPYRP
jgi:AcrR family transcriptional regulator